MPRVLIGVFLFLGACATGASGSTVQDVDVAGLRAALDRGEVPVLLDVRTPEEFAAGHVPSAKNVPLDELPSRLAEAGPEGAKVYVICQSGRRSAQASQTLAASGRVPINVLGGTAAWRGAGLQIDQ